MIGDSLVEAFGKDLNKSFGSRPGSTGPRCWSISQKLAEQAGIDTNGAIHWRII